MRTLKYILLIIIIPFLYLLFAIDTKKDREFVEEE